MINNHSIAIKKCLHLLKMILTQIGSFNEEKEGIQFIKETQLSCVILNVLYGLLEDQSTANKQFQKAFFRCLKQYFQMTENWMNFGIITDNHKEFFIQSSIKEKLKSTINFTDKLDWNNEFKFKAMMIKHSQKPGKFRKEENAHQIMIPCFLRSFAEQIFKIGVSNRVYFSILTKQGELQQQSAQCSLFEEIIGKLLIQLQQKPIMEIEKQEPQRKDVLIFNYTYGRYLYQEDQPVLDKQQKIKESLIIDANQTSEKLEEVLSTPSKDNQVFKVIKDSTLKLSGKEIVCQKKLTIKDILRSTKQQRHLTIILQEIMSQYFAEKSNDVQKRLFELFEQKFHLKEYLNLLRMVYFFQGKIFLNSFLVQVYEQINKTGQKDNIIRLNNLLQDGLCQISSPNLGDFHERFKLLIKMDPTRKKVMYELANMRLSFEPPYPLDIIVDKTSLRQYDNIFKFILLIKQAKYFMKKTDFILKKHKDVCSIEIEHNRKVLKKLKAFRNNLTLFSWELFHFVNNFEFFMMGQILTSETQAFQQKIQDIHNIYQLFNEHRTFLKRIMKRSLLSQGKGSLNEYILNIFTCIIQFYTIVDESRSISLTDQNSEIMKEVDSLYQKTINVQCCFHKNNRILLKVLHEHSNQGKQIEFREFLFQMNSNGFYLNESGHYLRYDFEDL